MRSLFALILTGLMSLYSFAADKDQLEEYVFSQAELDQMLAPIALYPDSVLSHILIAATYPLEIVQAERWLSENTEVDSAEVADLLEDKEWDPSVKALIAFPHIISRMSAELDWTQSLGDAFLQDEQSLLERVQVLRKHAYEEGNLDSLEHVSVKKEKDVIVIEPAVREVVYVPTYNTRYVYGPWWWDNYPPVYWGHPGRLHVGADFYWGPRIHLRPAFYFSAFRWSDRHVVVVDRRHRYRHRHRHYTRRHIAEAGHWRHNPRHRRGVAYRSRAVGHRYIGRHHERNTRPRSADRVREMHRRVVNQPSSRRSVENRNARVSRNVRTESPRATPLNRASESRSTRVSRTSGSTHVERRTESRASSESEGRRTVTRNRTELRAQSNRVNEPTRRSPVVSRTSRTNTRSDQSKPKPARASRENNSPRVTRSTSAASRSDRVTRSSNRSARGGHRENSRKSARR